jgi:hypothetical protein
MGASGIDSDRSGRTAAEWTRRVGESRLLRRALACAAATCAVTLAPALTSAAGAAGTGSIAGTVTEPGGTKGLPGLCVTAYEEHAFPENQVETDSNGQYTISGLPAGQYIVSFHNCYKGTLDFAPQFYNGQSEESKANKVSVVSGATTPSIDAEMHPGAEIEGTVLNAKGAGLANVCVAAYPATINSFPAAFFASGTASTDANGQYTIVGLATASYVVEYVGCGQNLVSAYYDEAEASHRTYEYSRATEIPLVTGEPARGLMPVHLQAGGEIEGSVTDSQGKVLTAPFCVIAENVHATSEEEGAGFAETTTGHYKIEGLPTGEYRLSIEECRGLATVEWASQYYNGVHKLAEATLISVTAGIEPELPATANFRLIRASATRPVNTSTPVASGTAAVGSSLSCSTGSWNGKPAPTFSYRWLRDGSAIAGATTSSYTVQTADEGHALSCVVTASNEAGSASSTSNAVQVPLPLPPPTNPPKEMGAPSVNGKTGAITFRYELPEGGTGSLTGVIAHGADIARTTAFPAKARRCGRKQVRRGRRCVNNGPVVYGSTSIAAGGAGTYTFTIRPHGTVLAALKKGKALVVTVTLAFTPAGTSDRIVQRQAVRVHLPRQARSHRKKG